jgi:hypothetical protein
MPVVVPGDTSASNSMKLLDASRVQVRFTDTQLFFDLNKPIIQGVAPCGYLC